VATASRLGIPETMVNGAARSSATVAMMHRLLRALAAFGVVKDLGPDGFVLTPGKTPRADDSQGDDRPIMLIGGDSYWRSFGKLEDCLRTGRNAYDLLYGVENCFAYYADHPEEAHSFDSAMSLHSAGAGAGIARAIDFTGVRRAVDVGGGIGRVLADILKARGNVRGTVFDLPRLGNNATELLAADGVADRCDFVGGICSIRCPPAAISTSSPM